MVGDKNIWVIIPVFNRWKYTQACLASLYVQTYSNYKVVVVDHGSTDNTTNNILSEFPGVIVVNGDESMWWAAATNLGVRYAIEHGAEFILSLNNDLIVLPDYLENMVATHDRHQPCLVGSVSVDILNADAMNYCGSGWNRFTAKYQSFSKTYSNSYTRLVGSFGNFGFLESDLLPGRGVLIPADAVRKIGYYDEKNFPHYAADEDFALRAKNAGYKIGVGVTCVVQSHLNATGLHAKNVKSFKDIKRAFFSIKSPLFFKVRYRWAIKHSPIKGAYFLFDMARLTVSLFK